LILAACRQDPIPEPALSGAGSPVSGDAFVYASLGDATRLNPLLTSDSATGEVCGYIFNGLVKYDRDLRLVGDLARSWEVRRGGKEILFHLRPGVRWHDGAPFTARDVTYTFERLRDPAVATPFGADFRDVQSVEAVDDLTVRVLYGRPFAPALESWGMGIIPRHVFEGTDFNAHPAHRRPVGTGPYRFVEWKTDEKIVLAANPDYFEGPPRIQRIIMRVIPDAGVQFLELRNGSVDQMGLTPDQYGAYPEFFKNYDKYRYPAFAYTFFAFNLDRSPFGDLRVRRALTLAVDKKEIIEGVLLGFGRSATGPFPPSSWAFNESVPDTPHDPAQARALLAQAGWRDTDGDGALDKDGKPFAFTVITNQGNKLRELAAVILQSHFAAVGVKMEIRILEWSTFIHSYVDKRNFDALILGWNLSRDPDSYTIWHSSQRGEGLYNFAGYADTEADSLLEEGRRTFDFAKRRDIYRRFHARVAEDAPYIFLYYPESLPALHKRFIGPEVAPAGLGWNFREWWAPKGRQKYQFGVTP
jgi:peptide/nickel transport system substrate-binding protein